MTTRLRWLCALFALASASMPAHGAFLDIVLQQQSADEGAPALVAVILTRDVNDTGACTVGGTVSTFDGTAVAGSDYTPLNAAVSLTLGVNDTQVQQVFSVNITEDTLFEAGDDFLVDVAEDTSACSVFPVQNNGPTTIAIADNEVLQASVGFQQTVVAVDETDGTVTLRVDLIGSQNIEGAFQANVLVTSADGTAQGGVDYQAIPADTFLNFDPTTLSQNIVIPILDDGQPEPSKSFTVQLSGAGISFPNDSFFQIPNGTDATVTILDDDGPGTLQLSASTYQVGEGDQAGGLAISVTRVGGRAGAASIDYGVTAGTATAGADFTVVSGTLNWAGGDGAAKTFVIPVANDGIVEQGETVNIALSNPAGATAGTPAGATLTIVDDDSPPSGGGDENITAPAGSNATATFAVTGTGPFTLAAQTGTVTPSTLSAPGNATYTLVIDPTTQAGTTINDVITITDGAGNVVTKQVAIQVTALVARDIADIPTLTPNQAEVAVYLDDLCPRLVAQGGSTADQADLIDVCAGLRNPATTDAQVIEALDQLSAQELITAATTTLRLAGMQHGNLTDRINSLRSGATGIDISGLDLEIDGTVVSGAVLAQALDALLGGAASADEFDRWGLFANGKVSYGDKDETAREAGFDFDTIGLTGGLDYRFDSNLVLGFAVGYAAVNSNFDQDRGGLDIESWSGSLFGTYFVADKFYVDAMLTYGQNDYDSVRHITFTDSSGLTAETATGDTDGMQLSGGFASGFDINRGKLTFGPHVGLYYVEADTDGFSESGAGGLNLVIDDQDATSFTVNAGGHLSYALTLGFGVLVPHLRLDYVHEFEDNRETVNLRFAADPFSNDPTDPTPVIALETDSPDPDYFVWSTGVSAQLVHGISGFVSYRSMAGFDDFSLGELTYGLRMETSL